MQAYDLGVTGGNNSQDRGFLYQAGMPEIMQSGMLNSFYGLPGQMQGAMQQMGAMQQGNAQRVNQTRNTNILANAQRYGDQQRTEQERIRAQMGENVQGQRTNALTAILAKLSGQQGTPDYNFEYGLPNPQASNTTLPALLGGHA